MSAISPLPNSEKKGRGRPYLGCAAPEPPRNVCSAPSCWREREHLGTRVPAPVPPSASPPALPPKNIHLSGILTSRIGTLLVTTAQRVRYTRKVAQVSCGISLRLDRDRDRDRFLNTLSVGSLRSREVAMLDHERGTRLDGWRERPVSYPGATFARRYAAST